MKGAYAEPGEVDNETKGYSARTYYRTIRSMDITNSEDNGKLKHLIEKVFNNLVMKVVIEQHPIENSEVEKWIDDLKTISCLHFQSNADEAKGDVTA